jgi:hypothetical protein
MYKNLFRTLVGLMALSLAGCPGSCTNPPTPGSWFTGLAHATVFGAWGINDPIGTNPMNGCHIDTPHEVLPAEFWAAAGTAKTNVADLVGPTIWAATDASCPRATQSAFRSVMVADLSSFYSKFPAGTAGVGNRVSSATLVFNVIPITPINPSNFLCDPYMANVGFVSILQPTAVIQQGSNGTPIPVDTHLNSTAGPLQATPATGQLDGPSIMGAFPVGGDQAANLGTVSAAGSFANNGANNPSATLVVADTGPNVHQVTVDVLKWVRGATNLNMQTLGFTVTGIAETTVALQSATQFDCRAWIEPTSLTVAFN